MNDGLVQAFEAIQFKGSYGITGRVAIETYELPSINVEGVGRLSWPINAHQIEQLKNVMEKSPFGNEGNDKIKKPSHIDRNKIEIDNSFDYLSETVTNQLALEEHEIEVRLNKLILQEEGEGYDWQQDTEKSNGKFGSLMIHLPSYHEGGDFFIKHDRTVIKSNYNHQKGENGFFYSAFYSDCYHKLNTITKGHRFTLLFDLVTKNSSGTNISIINVNTEAKHKLEQFIHTVRVDAEKVKNNMKFLIPLDYKYSDENCLLKGRDREKISLLQNMKDENGNDLFFIAVGVAKCTISGEDEDDFDSWDIDDTIVSITYLPHSFLKKPENFDLNFNNDSWIFRTLCSKNEFDGGFEDNYKDSFAVIWLTDHHFPLISMWNDITDEICELVQSHPDYGNKYVDDLITKRINIINVAKSTFLLRDKDRFLRAIACEPAPKNTEDFYKIISDSVENEFVTWNEVIPQIGRFMGKFDNNQAKFFSDIKDTHTKLNLFNEIKKSANFKSSGLHSWLDAHKEVDCSIDYIFEIFHQWDNDLDIELFIYCVNHQLFQKALECGKYLCPKLDTIFCEISDNNFYNKIISNFIKLNDDKCLRNLIEFLLPQKDVEIRILTKKEKFWKIIGYRMRQTSKLIPYIFEFLGQNASLNISQFSLFTIFNMMHKCAKEKIFISPKQYYVLLFNRINYEYVKRNSGIQISVIDFANKMIQMGDESNHKSFIIQIKQEHYLQNSLQNFKLTRPFSNIYCDSCFENTNRKRPYELFEMGWILVKGNIDDIRLKNLLTACSRDFSTTNKMRIADAIINCGRANDCDLCSLLADISLDLHIPGKQNSTIFKFLLSVIRNDDIGVKFLLAINIKVANNANLLQRKLDFVDGILFYSDLHLESNIFNYSPGFLCRIESLISFEIDYCKTYKIQSWVYPGLLKPQQTVRRGVLEFLKQDIPASDDSFGFGTFVSITQAKKEASFLEHSFPGIEVIADGSGSSAHYKIRKQKVFPDIDKTNKRIQQLTSMFAHIASNNNELKNFGLPVISTRAPSEDEPPMKRIITIDDH